MRIPEFRPAIEGDYPGVKDKAVFEIIEPVQRVCKELVRLTNKLIGPDNMNEDIIQVDIEPGVWTQLDCKKVKGVPIGALPLLVDFTTGFMSGWNIKVIEPGKISVILYLTSDTDSEGNELPLPAMVSTRWWVKGS